MPDSNNNNETVVKDVELVEVPVEATKPWWKSKGVVGGLLTAVLGLLVTFGVLTPEAATTDNIEAISTTWVDVATSIGIVVGGILSVYGRLKATKKIGK